MLIINKTHPKSWFRHHILDSPKADNLFRSYPKYKFDNSTVEQDIVVLQVLCMDNNRGIFEIVLKSDYEQKKEPVSSPSNIAMS